jgi:hypothetical protein
MLLVYARLRNAGAPGRRTPQPNYRPVARARNNGTFLGLRVTKRYHRPASLPPIRYTSGGGCSWNPACRTSHPPAGPKARPLNTRANRHALGQHRALKHLQRLARAQANHTSNRAPRAALRRRLAIRGGLAGNAHCCDTATICGARPGRFPIPPLAPPRPAARPSCGSRRLLPAHALTLRQGDGTGHDAALAADQFEYCVGHVAVGALRTVLADERQYPLRVRRRDRVWRVRLLEGR